MSLPSAAGASESGANVAPLTTEEGSDSVVKNTVRDVRSEAGVQGAAATDEQAATTDVARDV